MKGEKNRVERVKAVGTNHRKAIKGLLFWGFQIRLYLRRERNKPSVLLEGNARFSYENNFESQF